MAVDVLSPRAVAEAWFAALDRGDIPAAVALLADDVYWENIPQVPGVSDIVPWTGTAHGVAEVGQAFATRDKVCQVIEFKPLNMVVDGNQAVGTVHDHAIIKTTGLPFDIEFASWMKIENGKIGRPVKGATLIGNGPDVLTRVSMVGADLKLDEGVGTCGKDGQSVPVGVGIPTLKVDRITVGGTGS